MKRNKYLKTGGVYLAFIVLAVSSLTSCLKDNGPGSVNFGGSPALLSFQYTGGAPTPYIAAIYGNASDTSSVEITLSVASLTLKNAVTCTVAIDDDGANAYIAADLANNGNVDHLMPTSLYTIQNGGKITINPGQQFAHMRINYQGQSIDFTKNYVFGLKLTDPSGAQLTSNLNNAIVKVVLKSVYAATYEASGVRHHPTLGALPFDYSVAMTTVDKTTIDGPALADLTDDLQIHVNPDNTCTVESTAEPLQLTPGATNAYDPATKTFTLNYFYAVSGAARTIQETLVYTGP